MGWRLQINFTDGTSELEDEIFESEEAALDELDTWSAWNEGRDTLELAGEDFMDVGIRDYDIWEE